MTALLIKEDSEPQHIHNGTYEYIRITSNFFPGTFDHRGIDYRCEEGRSPLSASCVVISIPDFLSSIKQGLIPGIRS
jgi:hypothetical protein